MKHTRALALAILTGITLVGSGCAVMRGQTDVGKYVQDREISTAVKAKLLEDKRTGGMAIKVETLQGTVQLSGFAKSQAEKQQAENIARTTKGVKHVEDKLVVGGKTEGTSGHEDTTKIVIKDDTTPMVKKGAEKTVDAAKKVGEVTSDAAKKTVGAVKNTDVKVKDDTHVEIHKDDGDPSVKTAGEATTDAAITSAVKSKFLADARVSGLKIDVDTSKGVVTLTGPVSSPSEKAAALDLARSTKGVKSVVDKLTVK